MKRGLLFINQYSGLAGAERILLSVATSPVIGADWEITFALPEPGWLSEELNAKGVGVEFFSGARLHYGRKSVLDVWRFLRGFPGQVARFRRLLRDCDAELIYMSSPRYVLQAVCATLGRRTRIVFHVQCIYSGLTALFLRLALRSPRITCIIANSNASERWVSTLLRRNLDIVCVPAWTPDPEGPGSQESTLKLPSASPSSFRFAIVGRIARIKGQDIFLCAARQLLHAGEEAEFYVVGSGEHFEPGFEASLRREFGSHRRIHFTGLINPVSSVYSQVSCVVVPSREEAFGLVPIEAMSHCLPVIVSDVSELPQIVGHGDEGLVFRSGDVGALAEAMKRLMQDSDLRSRLAKAGREKVRANYSSGHGINRIGSILRSLVSATSETREHGRAAHFNKGGPRRDQSSVGSRKR